MVPSAAEKTAPNTATAVLLAGRDEECFGRLGFAPANAPASGQAGLPVMTQMPADGHVTEEVAHEGQPHHLCRRHGLGKSEPWPPKAECCLALSLVATDLAPRYSELNLTLTANRVLATLRIAGGGFSRVAKNSAYGSPSCESAAWRPGSGSASSEPARLLRRSQIRNCPTRWDPSATG